ncbi:polysaccharide biosynthesis/export family protein [Acinetobacter qingfengensis]|uniref:polysaccharide biosynthesis/export family protein n=1 Tax=Acinetobacter qingfengensis TaxID=1262585 RepID=UPI0038737629
MKLKHSFLIISLALLSSGCATMSGFQTYNLPEQGTVQTDLGTSVEVIPINQQSLNHIQQTAFPQSNYQLLSTLFQAPEKLYKLSAGDVLSIQLWAYPEITPLNSTVNSDQAAISSGYRIDQSGNIYFPLVGTIKAAGKSVTQFNQELSRRLASYLKHPDAVVRVISYQGQPFSVVGYVNKSGQFYLNDQPISIYAAIGMAGGMSMDNSLIGGDNASIQLIRNGITYNLNPVQLEKIGLSLQRLYVQPHDTIYVNSRESQKVYVMGEATKTQSIPLRVQGMTLSDVLGESAGINPLSASAKRIYILRTDPAHKTTQLYHMDLSNIADFGLANQFAMSSNDIVYVDATGLTRWQRVVNQIIPFSNALYNVDRLGN